MNKNIIKILGIIVFLVLIGVVFFSYDVMFTWDSSEYVALSTFIGTDKMTTDWIGHRGILFPLLLKFPDYIGNFIGVLSFKIYLFLFYCMMLCGICLIFDKCKQEIDLFNNKPIKILFITMIFIFVILNPIIFAYYHCILTEFVSITCAVFGIFCGIKWIDINPETDKKGEKIYILLFSILALVMYHTKQSLIPCVLGIIAISALFSILNNFTKKNIISKIFSILIVCFVVIISVLVWNYFMRNANVGKETYEKRVVLKKTDGLNSKQTIQSYYNDFKTILCLSKKYKIEEFNENTVLLRIFLKDKDFFIVGTNAKYYKYISKYGFLMSENNITKVVDKIVKNTYKVFNVIIKVNMFITPLIYLVMFVTYLIFRKKIIRSTRRIFEYSIICYTTALSIVSAYIIFTQLVDRYIVPGIIPMFLGDFFVILLIVNLLHIKLNKNL